MKAILKKDFIDKPLFIADTFKFILPRVTIGSNKLIFIQSFMKKSSLFLDYLILGSTLKALW